MYVLRIVTLNTPAQYEVLKLKNISRGSNHE